MPIVLSYEDVEGLGSLAFEGAKAGALGQGQFQNRALTSQIEADRDRTATQLQAISSRERQLELDRQFSGQQADLDRQLQVGLAGQQMDLSRAQMEAGIVEADIRAQADLQQELLGDVSQQERDRRLHGQRLTEIEHRAQFKGQEAAVGLGADGVPNKKFSQQEAQQFGNLIPYGTERAVSGGQAARSQERGLKTAQGLSSLPTSQLQGYIQSGNIDQQWEPYVRAVVQARQAISGGGVPTGVMPTGASVPGQRVGAGAAQQSLTQGQGLGLDQRFQALGDAELNQIANDPVLLNRFLGGQ